VILCGDRSSDEGTGAIGPALAELTDAAHLTGVDAVELEGDLVIARRGSERLRVSPAIVLCIAATADAPDPAPPANGTIEVLGLDTLGLDPRVLTHRRATAGAITSGAKDQTVPGVPTPDFGPEPDA
jgi:electron transfer flavoprotein alpha/beta subunit